jgi:hypothetical protein
MGMGARAAAGLDARVRSTRSGPLALSTTAAGGACATRLGRGAADGGRRCAWIGRSIRGAVSAGALGPFGAGLDGNSGRTSGGGAGAGAGRGEEGGGAVRTGSGAGGGGSAGFAIGGSRSGGGGVGAGRAAGGGGLGAGSGGSSTGSGSGSGAAAGGSGSGGGAGRSGSEVSTAT